MMIVAAITRSPTLRWREGVVSECSNTKIHLTVGAHGKQLHVICHPKFARGLQTDSKRSRRHDGRPPIFRKRQQQRRRFGTSPAPRNARVVPSRKNHKASRPHDERLFRHRNPVDIAFYLPSSSAALPLACQEFAIAARSRADMLTGTSNTHLGTIRFRGMSSYGR